MYRVRNAVQYAAMQLGDPYDDIIVRHAACLKFKNRGECGEMAYAAASQSVKFSPTFYLVFNGRNSHALTVLSEDSEAVLKYIEECYCSKKNILDVLKSLPSNSIIVDPFLSVVCSPDMIHEDGKDLVKYIQQNSLREIANYSGFKIESPSISEIAERAVKIYEVAGKILKDMKFDSIQGKILRNLLNQSCEFLSDSFGVTWGIDLKTKDLPLIFSVCSKEKSEEIQNVLNQSGIACEVKKVKNEESYCILVKEVHPHQLKEKLKNHNFNKSESRSKDIERSDQNQSTSLNESDSKS
jgi:hypothetical protein